MFNIFNKDKILSLEHDIDLYQKKNELLEDENEELKQKINKLEYQVEKWKRIASDAIESKQRAFRKDNLEEENNRLRETIYELKIKNSDLIESKIILTDKLDKLMEEKEN